MSTIATLTATEDEILLRLRFPEGVVVNIRDGKKFRVTSSSPALHEDFRHHGPLSKAFAILKQIETAGLPDETRIEKLSRFKSVAEQSAGITDFVRRSGLKRA
jgi:hypothetical protein